MTPRSWQIPGCGVKLSDEWFAKRHRAMFIGWFLVLAGIGMAVAGVATVDRSGAFPWMLVASPLVFLGGAIYGLYHLAEAHLGADPFKHLTGYRPPARCPIVLKDPDFTAAPPAFRFRGWHIESHGLMSPWRGTAEHQHANWERFFETLLRCGGNMVKPEINRPESLEVATAQRRG